jgi:thymidylate synthase (FAD)
VFTFEVKAPIFVFRQWHRHRTQSYNELSARYKELPTEFYIPEANIITEQSTDNKQMRTDNQHPLADAFRECMEEQNKQAFILYNTLLEGGCPRELARTILPVGTYSHMFCTVNLHNLFHFLRERLHPHAQYEIRVFAEAILELIEPVVPECVKIFKENLK